MKLEDQVCSLELAKKLKKLGVKQESIFAHSRPSHVQDFNLVWNANCQPSIWEDKTSIYGDITEEIYSAFTAAELGEMLPTHINNENWLYIWRSVVDWTVAYADLPQGGGMDIYIDFCASTETDARAKMLTFLKENSMV